MVRGNDVMKKANNNGNKPTVWNIGIPLVIACMLLASTVLVQYRIANAFPEPVPTETETEQNYFTPTTELEEEITTPIPIGVGMYEYNGVIFIHCEVTETNSDTFVTLLPNGELHEFYMIQDPPIDDNGNPWFSLVWFVVEKGNESNLDAWRVLTVD